MNATIVTFQNAQGQKTYQLHRHPQGRTDQGEWWAGKHGWIAAVPQNVQHYARYRSMDAAARALALAAVPSA